MKYFEFILSFNDVCDIVKDFSSKNNYIVYYCNKSLNDFRILNDYDSLKILKENNEISFFYLTNNKIDLSNKTSNEIWEKISLNGIEIKGLLFTENELEVSAIRIINKNSKNKTKLKDLKNEIIKKCKYKGVFLNNYLYPDIFYSEKIKNKKIWYNLIDKKIKVTIPIPLNSLL